MMPLALKKAAKRLTENTVTAHDKATDFSIDEDDAAAVVVDGGVVVDAAVVAVCFASLETNDVDPDTDDVDC